MSVKSQQKNLLPKQLIFTTIRRIVAIYSRLCLKFIFFYQKCSLRFFLLQLEKMFTIYILLEIFQFLQLFLFFFLKIKERQIR